MNALSRSARFALPRANTMAMGVQSRMSSNMSYFKKHWTQDSGTYPVIAVVSFAVVVCSARLTHAITSCPDVRITPTARQEIFRPHS